MNLLVSYRRAFAFFILCSLMLFGPSLWGQPFFLPGISETAVPEHDEGEREEYNPLRNPWWTQLSSSEYLQALINVERMPSEQEMEYGSEKGSSVAAGRSWVGIGPSGGALLRNLPNRFHQGRIRSIYWWKNPATGEFTPVIGASSGGLYYRYRRFPRPGYRYQWRSIGASLPNPSVGAVVVHPNDFGRMIVGTGDWARYSGGGVFLTTNRGESWTNAPLLAENGRDTIVPKAITGIDYGLTPSGLIDTSTLYLSSDNGFFKSIDGGRTWRRRAVVSGNSRNPIFSMAADKRRRNVIYLGLCAGPLGESGWQGVHKSTDGGESWNPVNNGLPSTGGRSLAIALSPSNSDILYAALASSADTTGGIYVTRNAGGRWDRAGSPNTQYMRMGQGVHTNCISVHPTNPEIVFAASVFLIKTTNGGTNWSSFIDGGHDDYQFISFSPTSTDTLYIGNDGGLFVRDDRNNTVRNDEPNFVGNSPLQSYGMDGAWSNSTFLVSGTQDNGTLRLNRLANTTDGRRGEWEVFSGCDGADDIAIHPTDERLFFFNQWCGGGGLRKRSRDKGATEEDVSRGLAEIWMTPLRINKGNTNYVFTPDTAWLYHSTNSGDSWRRTTGGTARDFPSWFPPRRIAMNSGTGGTVVCYTTGWGDSAIKVRIHEGTPGSMTIREARIAPPDRVREVITDRWDPERAWAITETDPVFRAGSRSGIFQTTDRGRNWTNITGTLSTGINYYDIQRNPDNPNVLYVSSDIGVFKTRSGGSSWYPLQQGLPIVGVNRMYYAPSADGNRLFDTLRISTYGYGFWERLLDREDPIWISLIPRFTDFIVLNDSLLRRILFRNMAVGGSGTGNRFGDLIVAVADSGIIARTLDGGRSWGVTELNPNDNFKAVAHRVGTSFVAVGDGGTILRTDDPDGKWIPQQSGVKVSLRSILFIDSLRGFVVGESGVILSTFDGGENWQVSRRAEQSDEVLHAIHFTDEKNGIATGYDRGFKPPIPVYLRTTNAGKTWEYDQSLFGYGIMQKIDIPNGKNGFALNENGLLKTSDGGSSWEPIQIGSQFTLRDFVVTTLDSVWVVGDAGTVYRTIDGGKSWEPEEVEWEGELRTVARGVSSLVALGDSTALLRAAPIVGMGGGRIPTDTTGTGGTSGVLHDAAAAGYALTPVIPNPFWEETEIGFTLPRSGTITIDIVDLVGRNVAVLESDHFDPGNYTIRWDGRDNTGRHLPGGVYFCRLQTPLGTLVQRVMIERR